MSNDDLFEDNEIVLDDIDPVDLKKDPVEKEAGFSADEELRKLARSLAEKLEHVDKFSFSLYSHTYFSFVNVPQLLVKELYDRYTSIVIAPYKVIEGQHDIQTVHFLLEMNRKIMIIGYNQSLFLQLLTVLEENSDGEPSDSFLIYFRDNLRKEVINSEFYLNHLLEAYKDYCSSHGITEDPNLLEYQLKTNMSGIEYHCYGSLVAAENVEHIGNVPDFVEKRDKLLKTIADSAFKFVNKIQSAIDEIKNEKERQLT